MGNMVYLHYCSYLVPLGTEIALSLCLWLARSGFMLKHVDKQEKYSRSGVL